MKSFKKNICVEEFVSRVPGLFPYIEFNELGELVKHKATNSVDGCYGKMIPDIKIGSLVIPYRKLMRDYYDKGANSYLVNRAMGRFKVGNLNDFTFDDDAILVPEYIYASEAKSLLNEMIRLKRNCQLYEENEIFKLSSLCCDCEEFRKRGGDEMIRLLEYLIDYAGTVADEMFNNTTSDASYGFFIPLTGSYEDIGYFTPYTEDGTFPLKTKEYTIIIGADNEVNTDSKLKSLRCYSTYLNTREQYEQPETGEDWLYFYQEGYVANYETVNDENGNIATIDDAEKVIEGGYVTNLLAYGSVITDIEVDKDEKSITFTYYINAHLKAKFAASEDGLDMYEFPFEYESGGVKQTETYFYASGGELDELVNNDEFEAYISMGSQNTPRKFETRKCAFSTIGSESSNKKQIWDKTVEIPYQRSVLEYGRSNKYQIYNADIFKEDYLIGVHFQPSVENKVNVRRGNNAAFERHIRLGEVKTLEDMENYMNGSFFNIQQIN